MYNLKLCYFHKNVKRKISRSNILLKAYYAKVGYFYYLGKMLFVYSIKNSKSCFTLNGIFQYGGSSVADNFDDISNSVPYN